MRWGLADRSKTRAYNIFTQTYQKLKPVIKVEMILDNRGRWTSARQKEEEEEEEPQLFFLAKECERLLIYNTRVHDNI